VSEEVFGRPLLKALQAFPDSFCPTPVFSLVNENDSPPGSMALSYLTERKGLVMTPQRAFFSNGCPK